MLTSALRSGCLSTASVAAATQSRSPGVSSAAFRAQSPNLRFAPLMDMDFAVSCPLVRHWRLISGFCPSTRTFAPRFLQTSPRGDSPCVITSPSPPSGWAEDFHLQAAEHAQHTTKPLRGGWTPCERRRLRQAFRSLSRTARQRRHPQLPPKGFLVPIQSSGLRLALSVRHHALSLRADATHSLRQEAQELALRAQHGGSGTAG